MEKTAHRIYTFDEFTLDLTRGSLFRASTELRLRAKSFDVLTYLVQNHGRLMSKSEIIQSVWNGTAVTDDSLVQCLSDIRRALGDDSQQIIKTVPRRGYVFEKEVVENGPAVYVEETSEVHLVIDETHESYGLDEKVIRLEQSDRRELPDGRKKRHKRLIAFAGSAIVLCIGGLAYGLFIFLRRPPPPAFRSVSIKPITTDDRAQTVAISPDGNYIAYVIRDNELESLWVRQVATVNPTQLAPPNKTEYGGLVFSPDSSFVFYEEADVLYKVPVLGGPPRKMLEDVKGTVTFSPDGKRLAFLRGGKGSGEQKLMLANVDGSGDEQTLSVRKSPEFFALPMFDTGPAWSPDGKIIACPGGDNGGFGQSYPIAVRVDDGSQRPMTTKRWNAVVQLAWLSDTSGLLMNAKDNGLDATRQIWHVSYPRGVPQRIYSDQMEYDSVSLAARLGLLVSIQREIDSNIWALDPAGESSELKQITTGTKRQDGYWGIDTVSDGRIVFDSRLGGSRDLWVMDANGNHQIQLTYDELFEQFVTASPNGRQILFHLGGKGLWIMDIDGSNRRQLTDQGMFPDFSPDGSWIVYTLPRKNWSLWRISSDGGEPRLIVDQFAVHPVISPDGRMVAYVNVSPGVAPNLTIISLDTGERIREWALTQPSSFAEWTRDGKALTYKQVSNGLSQIVNQSLDGDQPQVIFTARSEHETIRGFAWSRDGKLLFLSIGPEKKNAVIFNLEK